MRSRLFLLLFVFLAFCFFLSCGGGSDAPPNPTVSGIAATGAAIPNSPVTLKDSAGKTNTGTTDSSGAYTISVAGMTAPFLINVTYSGANTLYSFATAPGTANINPLTNLAVYHALNNDPTTTFATGAAAATISAAMTTLTSNMNSAITAIKNNLLANYPAIKIQSINTCL